MLEIRDIMTKIARLKSSLNKEAPMEILRLMKKVYSLKEKVSDIVVEE